MFTGIITSQQRVIHSGNRLRVELAPGTTSLDPSPVQLGESIALNGVCLTLAAQDANAWEFDLSPETLARTNLDALTEGDILNCERALRASDRISGHWVQGHVDGIARLSAVRPEKECFELTFELSYSLGKYCVEKGSICINGVSLTVNSTLSSRKYDGIEVTVMIIPHTWSETNLSRLRVGDRVNIETDLIAKYVEKLCRH